MFTVDASAQEIHVPVEIDVSDMSDNEEPVDDDEIDKVICIIVIMFF